MNKKVPLWLLILVVYVGLNILVVFGWAVRHTLIAPGKQDSFIGSVVLPIASFPSMAQEALYELGILKYELDVGEKEHEKAEEEDRVKKLPPLVIQNEFPELDGFVENGIVQNGVFSDDGYLLLSFWSPGEGQSVVQLIRIDDQKVLHEWKPDLAQLVTVTNQDINNTRYRMFHPLLTEDGGLVFSGQSGSLVKIGLDSSIKWVVNGKFHHTKEQDADGNLWVCGLKESDKYSRYEKMLGQKRYRDETIVKISPKGKILYEKSVTDILLENGYRGLLFGVQRYEPDLLHLNDVEPALYSTKFWNKGDLLLSFRHISTVLLYRPKADRLIWLRTGPWINQHDADFSGDNEITIFGNDNIREDATNSGPILGGHNEIYVFNLEMQRVSTPYTEAMKSSDIRTTAEGLHKLLPNGDVFIEETLRGRLLRISKRKAVWQFTKKASSHSISLLNWTRHLSKDYVEDMLSIFHKVDEA